MKTQKKLKLHDVEPIAQKAVRNAFGEAIKDGAVWLTTKEEARLYKEILIKDDTYTFELLFHPEGADQDSRNPYIVARVVINRYTGELIKKVDVFLPPILCSQLQTES